MTARTLRPVPALVLVAVLGLAGCVGTGLDFLNFKKPAPDAPPAPPPIVYRPDDTDVRPKPRPGPARPPAGANTAEALDVATDSERRAATRPVSSNGELLGHVVGSLGDVRESGFWLKTPLVTKRRKGRVVVEGGKSVKVDLIPREAGGNQLSLPAMRVLGVPLTELPKLTVYAQ